MLNYRRKTRMKRKWVKRYWGDICVVVKKNVEIDSANIAV